MPFVGFSRKFPESLSYPPAYDIDKGVKWAVQHWRSFFRTITSYLLVLLVPLEDFMLWIPWWLFMSTVGFLAWRASGKATALGSIIGMLFLGAIGVWDQAMRTVAVVGSATVLAVTFAIPIGIVMSKSDKIEKVVRPVLDMMQTMPSFVYLIPCIYFMGLGKVPAVLATLVYAVPPAIRLTNLGIRLVSPELKEAARAFGTTGWQMLIKIELPLARPTIMAGVNQTVMMALAMVVIASMVGAPGLGADVLAGVVQLEFGRGLMAGLGIVVMAVIIDRIAQGLAKDARNGSAQ
ncbi:proline/glycine betaine ABC transporter permease [SAR202 cluster bacterium AD-804-J14_MRT_500m]|nr:proline/glycine betaine ABC transporter permease [SAR202 cluster bacterium AD-804-J14_MRT_500m]